MHERNHKMVRIIGRRNCPISFSMGACCIIVLIKIFGIETFVAFGAEFRLGAFHEKLLREYIFKKFAF